MTLTTDTGLTATDFFCGMGGSSTGLTRAGFTSGSLFAGYGGLHRGVEHVFGARLAWVSDIPQYDAKGVRVGDAPAILAHRYPGVPNLGDITTVDWDTVPRVDIIDGGSPCQDVSVAGKRVGMVDGTRSNLWVAMRDAIATIQPAFVIWENVRGALSAPAASAMESDPGLLGDHRGVALRAAGRVLGDLADLGFDAEWEGLRAADVGAPHGRWRVFVLAAHPERVARLERLFTSGPPPWARRAETPRRDRAPISGTRRRTAPTDTTTGTRSARPSPRWTAPGSQRDRPYLRNARTTASVLAVSVMLLTVGVAGITTMRPWSVVVGAVALLGGLGLAALISDE